MTFSFSVFPFLAARSRNNSDEDKGKVIYGVIFVIIWIISAVVSKLGKKPPQTRQPTPPPTPPQAPTTIQQPRELDDQLRLRREAAERHRQQVRAQLERARQMASGRTAPAPPPLPNVTRRQPVRSQVVVAPPPPEPVRPDITPNISAPSPARRPAVVASAMLLRRWLTPQTLRSQFILTEILQPPLALRDDKRTFE